MAIANDPTNPANMSPEERLTEVAAILAQGVQRLRRRQAVFAADAPLIHPVESEESAGTGLEVSSESSPHGQRG